MNNEWEQLPYSKLPVQCNHCGHKTPMRVLSEKRITEVLYYRDYEDSSMWTQWQVLKCPLCEKINVLESHSVGYDDEVEIDENGEAISTEVVHTTVLYPIVDATIPKSHLNMPGEIAKDYDEAKLTFPFSARSSAALLRLVIQKLCRHLGESGKDIDSDIKSLVKNGLPTHIQQALDIVRVVGNEAVHPGEINIQDNPEVAKQLFDLINEIVDDRIGKVQKQAEIEELYKKLPEKKLEHIRDRDKDK